MADPRNFWHMLPHYAKQDVVHYLDFGTRCELSYCSKSDLKLVRSTPIAFRNISWDTENDEIRCLSFCTRNCPEHHEFLAKSENTQQIVDSLCHMFRAPNTCEFFDCSAPNPQISEVIRELKNQNILPRIKCIDWKETVDDVFYDFLTGIDCKYLEVMAVESEDETSELVERIVETDQWKNLKVVAIEEDLNPAWKLESILEKPMFDIRINELSVETAHRIIKIFQEKNHPVGSCFCVTFDEINVLEMYDNPGELIEDKDSESHYLKTFPLANDSLELRVHLITEYSRDSLSIDQISGIVTRKDENFKYFDISEKITSMLHS